VKPLGAETLGARPHPAGSREEALDRWAAVEARDDETIDERCQSWSLIQDESVETTVVLLHGYTNCPFMYRRRRARGPDHQPQRRRGKPGTVEAIVATWQQHGANASVYEWLAEMGLGHNMVDDAVNTGKFDAIYPILMELFTEGQVTAEPARPDEEPAGDA